MTARKENSLLPYLTSETGKFSLKLCPADPEAPNSGENPMAFPLIDDADPIGDLVFGEVITDTGAIVLPVFLHIQKDLPLLSQDELFPVTNQSIEQSWATSLQNAPDGLRLTLQHDSSGHPVPMQSLFFCRRSQRYFHPPCPTCGQTLQLCKEDSILFAQNLQPYNDSLQRYLFCPRCHERGEIVFFALKRSFTDPGHVADSDQLLERYRQLLHLSGIDINLPCQDCRERQRCAEAVSPGLAEIDFFRFYPFFIQITPAANLGAPEYLMLLSGASRDEIRQRLWAKQQSGRVYLLDRAMPDPPTELFMFPRDSRLFPETLFLKLNFLEDLFTSLLEKPCPTGYTEAGSLIRNTWIRFSEGSLLPGLWSYHSCRHHPGRLLPSSSGLPDSPVEAVFHNMGLLWFYALTMNNRQNSTTLFHTLRRMLELPEPDSMQEFKELADRTAPGVFSPGQLFWNPDFMPQVPDQWIETWWQCLDLGWQILLSAGRGGRKSSDRELLSRISTLKQNVKARLFNQLPEGQAPKTIRENEDLDVILSNIEKRWLSQPSGQITVPPSSPGEKKPLPPELEETMLAGSVEQRFPVGNQPKKESLPDSHGDSKETVIISAAGTSTLATRVMKQQLRRTGTSQPPEATKDTDELPPTIHAGESPPSQETSQAAPHRSSLSRTIARTKESITNTDDDVLAETIVIRPSNKNNK